MASIGAFKPVSIARAPRKGIIKKRLAPPPCQSQQLPPPRLILNARPHIAQNFAVRSSNKAFHSDHDAAESSTEAAVALVRAASVVIAF